jgi:hypothetical protein
MDRAKTLASGTFYLALMNAIQYVTTFIFYIVVARVEWRNNKAYIIVSIHKSPSTNITVGIKTIQKHLKANVANIQPAKNEC